MQMLSGRGNISHEPTVSPLPSAQNNPQAQAARVRQTCLSPPVPPRNPLEAGLLNFECWLTASSDAGVQGQSEMPLRCPGPPCHLHRHLTPELCLLGSPPNHPLPPAAQLWERAVSSAFQSKWWQDLGQVSLETQPESGGHRKNSGSVQFPGRNKTEKTVNSPRS